MRCEQILRFLSFDLYRLVNGEIVFKGKFLNGRQMQFVSTSRRFVRLCPDGGYLVTWGRRVRFSWTFLRVYADTIFAVLSQDMMGPDGKAPNGFDLDQLRADLAAL